MNGSEFVEAVKHYVRDVAVQDVITGYLEPPGRSPNRNLVPLSNWYNSLDESERVMVNRIIKESVDAGLFWLLLRA
jgi:streptomycin 6-kinase